MQTKVLQIEIWDPRLFLLLSFRHCVLVLCGLQCLLSSFKAVVVVARNLQNPTHILCVCKQFCHHPCFSTKLYHHSYPSLFQFLRFASPKESKFTALPRWRRHTSCAMLRPTQQTCPSGKIKMASDHSGRQPPANSLCHFHENCPFLESQESQGPEGYWRSLKGTEGP
jgi:hypothetical protein